MLFKDDLAQKIVKGAKTQTRRPIKGAKLIIIDGKKTVLLPSGRIKMQVGRDYAVQYGRGRPTRWWHPERCELLSYDTYLDILSIMNPQLSLEEMDFKPLRIKILDIWSEHVAEISHSDSVREGFAGEKWFWQTWCGFYDEKALAELDAPSHQGIGVFRDYLQTRSESQYRAFAYEFEVMR